MQSTVTDRVEWSVRRSVIIVSPEKTVEPIQMPFGLRPGNQVLNWGPDPSWEEAILRGKGVAHCKVKGHSAVICARMAELILMPFGRLARTHPRNHELDGDPDPP